MRDDSSLPTTPSSFRGSAMQSATPASATATRTTHTVRPATAADLPRVRALLAAASLPSADVDAQFGAQYAVAVSAAGDVIGAEGIELYADDAARYGLLRSAVVDPAWRGRGVGEALTRDRLAWARSEGLAAVYLLTTTAADYFPKFGFAPVDRAAAPAALQASSEFASVCPSSAVTMRLLLGGE